MTESTQQKRPLVINIDDAKRLKTNADATLIGGEKENSENEAAAKKLTCNDNVNRIVGVTNSIMSVEDVENLCKTDPAKLVDVADSNDSTLKLLKEFVVDVRRTLTEWKRRAPKRKLLS